MSPRRYSGRRCYFRMEVSDLKLNLKIRRVAFVANLIALDSKGTDVILGIESVKQAQGTHRLWREAWQAYHPG
jgi:hypothetical protein